MSRTRVLTTTLALALMGCASVLTGGAAHADSLTPGTFNTLAPSRILDTRTGVGAPRMRVPGHGTLTFSAEPAGVTGAAAVALGITAVTPAASGYLTVFAAGQVRPGTSNLNFATGQTVPNLVMAEVGTSGQVSVYNGSAGPVDVVADLSGYVTGGAPTEPEALVTLAPTRILDTRTGVGATARGAATPGAVSHIQIGGLDGIPATASAVLVNVTAVGGDAGGYLTAYPSNDPAAVSTVNFKAHQNRADLAVVALGADGAIDLRNSSPAAVNEIVDVAGYYLGGAPAADGTLVPTQPQRLLDTRLAGGSPIPAGATAKIAIFPPGQPGFDIFKAAVVTVTVTRPRASGFLTVWDGATTVPNVSNSNFAPGDNAAGLVIVPIDSDGTISVHNASSGTIDLVVDLSGFFLNVPENTPSATSTAQSSTARRLQAALTTIKGLAGHPAAKPTHVTA